MGSSRRHLEKLSEQLSHEAWRSRESRNKSAASAASLGYIKLNFQAVIKSAASAASMQEAQIQERKLQGSAPGLAVLEAALAANLMTA